MQSTVAEPVERPATQGGLLLSKLHVENFMRLRALTVELGGRHLKIFGPNGSGKTSAVDAVWAILGGKTAKDLPEPVHHGERKAVGRLELADEDGKVVFTVQRTWTGSSSELVVSAADGSRFRRPQEVLDGFIDRTCLDPCSFLRKPPKEQLGEVLEVMGIEPPVAKVKELAGEIHEPMKGEAAAAYLERLTSDAGAFYVRRQEANRELKQKEAARDERRRQLAGASPAGEPELSIEDALRERDTLTRQKEARQQAVAAAGEARQRHTSASEKLAVLENARAAARKQREALLKQVEELDQQLGELGGRIEKGGKVCQDLDAIAKAAEEATALYEDPAGKIAELDRKIKASNDGRQERERRAVAERECERLEQEAIDLRARADRWQKVIDGLRKLKAELLDGLDLGVPGLALGDGELVLNGVSFRQASHAERIRVACALAFRRSPRLRLLRLDDAEHLDQKSLDLLLELAGQYGWQCILTFVRDTGSGLGFVLGDEKLPAM